MTHKLKKGIIIILICISILTLPSQGEVFANRVLNGGENSSDLSKYVSNDRMSSFYKDVPVGALYKEAVDRLTLLGIISGDTEQNFYPMDKVTRAQFAKIAVCSVGLKEQATTEKGVSIFNDVSSQHWATGFINIAAKNGYINGFGDGNFKPDENITYAQVVTISLKLLGYESEDLGGIWPYNYIEKAGALNITSGISLKPTDFIDKSTTAIIVDKTLNSDVKRLSSNEIAKALIEKAELSTVKECIITGTPNTDFSIVAGKVRTDIGEYTDKTYSAEKYTGMKVTMLINKDNDVIGILPKQQINRRVVVQNVSGNSVRVYEDSATDNSNERNTILTIPDTLTIFFKENKGTFASQKNNISLGSSLILSGSLQGSFDYGVLFDPDLTEAFVVTKDITNTDTKIGSIDISDRTSVIVIRNGEEANINGIKAYDVVYSMKHSPDKVKRLFVFDNKIIGSYDEALPSKAFVNRIVVSGQEIEIETQKASSKLDESPGAYKINDSITVLTGKDGRAVDVVDVNARDISNFAVVLNSREAVSEEQATKGQREYYVKIFTTDGNTKEYKADDIYDKYKGRLVNYTFKNGLMSLNNVKYNSISGKLDKSERRLGDNWITRDAVLLDLVSNHDNRDAVVQIIKLSDLYMNNLSTRDVIHAEIQNDFNDIQLLFLNNISYNSYKYGVLTEKSDSSRNMSIRVSYKIDIKGDVLSFNNSNVKFGPSEGQAIGTEIIGNSIENMFALEEIELSGKIEAFDDERVKVKDKIIRLSKDVQAYRRAVSGKIEPVSINTLYAEGINVRLYADRSISSGGLVRIIIAR